LDSPDTKKAPLQTLRLVWFGWCASGVRESLQQAGVCCRVFGDEKDKPEAIV
jgi:hypothetical protein